MAPLARATAACSAAVSAWAALGAVAVAPGTTTATRVGVLPPWWVLGALLAVSLLFVFAARLPNARVRPLFGALLCLLPWMPGPVPAVLLAWQGWLAGLVWIGVAVAVIAAAPINAGGRPRGWATAPSRAPWLAAVLATVVFGLAWRGTAAWLPGGDEPHYLVITQSLLSDGDLRIEDNHARRQYLAYVAIELRPDFLRRGQDGQIYSIHAPGISAIVAPAFLVGGYRGAAIFILLGCALGAALAWRFAWEVTGAAGPAWFGWATLVSAMPIVAHAYTIYPDGLSGVLVLAAAYVWWRAADPTPRLLAAGGVALAALPWLHTRNAVIAAALGAAVLARAWRRAPAGGRWPRVAALLGVPVLAALAWFGYFFLIYGTLDPSAPYGGYTQSAPVNLLRGVPGLLFDQQFGAIANAPGLWAAVLGAGLLAFARRGGDGRRDDRALAAMLAATVVPYLLVTASYYMWWGGTSAPARFLVPVLWLAAVPAAAAWARLAGAADRAVLLGLVVLSAATTMAASYGATGLLTFTTRRPHGPFEEWATRAVDLSMALPSLLRDAPLTAWQQAVLWTLALAGWWLALRVVGATRARAAAWAVPLAVLAVSASLSANWRLRDVDPLRPDASRHAVLDAAWLDGAGVLFQRTEVEGRRRRAGLARMEKVLPLIELRTTTRGIPPGRQLAGLSGLPAGDYRVKVAGADPRHGSVRVEVGRGGGLRGYDLATLPAATDGRAVFDLTLPVGVDALVVLAAEGSTASASVLAPLRLHPRGRLVTRDRAIFARGYPGADVYFTTDGQYAEPGGIWVKAGAPVPIVVHLREAADRVPVFLRNGPLPNDVVLRAGDWRQSVSLTPGQEAGIDWPWLDGERTRLLEVSASAAFRPADVDPASQDLRRLGVWIEFRGHP